MPPDYKMSKSERAGGGIIDRRSIGRAKCPATGRCILLAKAQEATREKAVIQQKKTGGHKKFTKIISTHA